VCCQPYGFKRNLMCLLSDFCVCSDDRLLDCKLCVPKRVAWRGACGWRRAWVTSAEIGGVLGEALFELWIVEFLVEALGMLFGDLALLAIAGFGVQFGEVVVRVGLLVVIA
jgi:hypothetical protein